MRLCSSGAVNELETATLCWDCGAHLASTAVGYRGSQPEFAVWWCFLTLPCSEPCHFPSSCSSCAALPGCPPLHFHLRHIWSHQSGKFDSSNVVMLECCQKWTVWPSCSDLRLLQGLVLSTTRYHFAILPPMVQFFSYKSSNAVEQTLKKITNHDSLVSIISYRREERLTSTLKLLQSQPWPSMWSTTRYPLVILPPIVQSFSCREWDWFVSRWSCWTERRKKNSKFWMWSYVINWVLRINTRLV